MGSQRLAHWATAHTQGPFTPCTRLGILAKTLNAIKPCKSRRIAIPQLSLWIHVLCFRFSCLGNELSTGICNKTSTSLGKLLCTYGLRGTTQSLLGSYGPAPSWTHWNVLYWNGTYTIKREEQVSVLTWHILSPVHLLMPDNVASLGQHVQYAQPGQAPKATILPLLKARWMHSLLHWCDHLATVFSPTIWPER